MDPNLFKGGKLKDFKEYAENFFLPNVMQKLQSCRRCDIIFGVYKDNSLKHYTRQMRGQGDRLKIEGNTRLPKNWHSFLRVDSNKTTHFSFLADQMKTLAIPEEKVLISTKEEKVIVNNNGVDFSTGGIELCNHKEADTRLLLQCMYI